MTRPRSYRTEALVLKSTPLGEAGLIVTLYSRDEGEIRAAVRGIRRPTSKLVGHLEPLTRVELALARPRLEGIDTITQVEILEGFGALKGCLEALSRGLYLAELVDRFGTEGSANPELYSLLVQALRTLEESWDSGLNLRYFELHLLKVSGFMPELYRCVECRDELSPGQHLFSPDSGGALCLNCTPAGVRIMSLSINALKVLRFLDRAQLQELLSLRMDGALKGELEALLGAAVNHWLDREIQSKDFMEHVQRFQVIGIN